MIDPMAEMVALLKPFANGSKLVEAAGNWRVSPPCTNQPFYCVILEGQTLLTVDHHAPLKLETGDFVLVPAMQHLVHSSIEVPSTTVETSPIALGEGHFRVGRQDGPVDLRMRIGHCRFGAPDAALLVPLLPQVTLVRGEARLASLVQWLGEETRAQRPGRELVLDRLLEILLIEALRGGSGPTMGPGLARGLADERLGIAIRALHADPSFPWTVSELAAKAALSRSAFFARFDRVVGMKPMEYLLTWRMAMAKQMLRERQASLEHIAERTGYRSANTFTLAFTRHVGQPPTRYRRGAIALAQQNDEQ